MRRRRSLWLSCHTRAALSRRCQAVTEGGGHARRVARRTQATRVTRGCSRPHGQAASRSLRRETDSGHHACEPRWSLRAWPSLCSSVSGGSAPPTRADRKTERVKSWQALEYRLLPHCRDDDDLVPCKGRRRPGDGQKPPRGLDQRAATRGPQRLTHCHAFICVSSVALIRPGWQSPVAATETTGPPKTQNVSSLARGWRERGRGPRWHKASFQGDESVLELESGYDKSHRIV